MLNREQTEDTELRHAESKEIAYVIFCRRTSRRRTRVGNPCYMIQTRAAYYVATQKPTHKHRIRMSLECAVAMR